MVSSDVERFLITAPFFAFMILAPLHLIASTYLLWTLVGPYALIGSGIMVGVVPFNMLSTILSTKFRSNTATLTDKRVKLMSEVLAGMRVIKMYAWEKTFAKVIGGVRSQEVKNIRKTNYLQGVIYSYYFVISTIVMLITFVTYELSGHQISPYIVFTAMGYLSGIQLYTGLYVPLSLIHI